MITTMWSTTDDNDEGNEEQTSEANQKDTSRDSK